MHKSRQKMIKKVLSWALPADSQGVAGDRLIKIRVYRNRTIKVFYFFLLAGGFLYGISVKVEE
jgi:hypothetical protein